MKDKKMTTMFNKCITGFDYAYKNFFLFYQVQALVFLLLDLLLLLGHLLELQAQVLVFLFCYRIFIFHFILFYSILFYFWKQWKKKDKIQTNALLAKSKLKSIEKVTSKALSDTEITHEEFMLIINEAKKYSSVKENMRKMKSQRSNIKQ